MTFRLCCQERRHIKYHLLRRAADLPFTTLVSIARLANSVNRLTTHGTAKNLPTWAFS